MEVLRKPIFGSILDQNPLVQVQNPRVSIPGCFRGTKSLLKINDSILSKHILLIGSTGCGKSNVFYHVVDQIKRSMSINDIMIIFDTKGDYYNLFSSASDLVIGNSSEYRHKSCKWNIFKEVVADGWEDEKIELNAQEISWSIFREAIEKSKDPFFVNAARDLFTAILLCIIKEGINSPDFKRKHFFNSELKRAINESTIADIKSMIETIPSLTSIISYIDDTASGQAMGVHSELTRVFRQIFTGVFADEGAFSIRDFARKKGGQTLFIEYDIAIGNTLSPIYTLLIDLAIKECLGRSHKEGNVYLIFDEFKLLPYIQHVEDGLNFGRGLGMRILAGLQSINQLTEIYGEFRGRNITAGFSTIVSFKANDEFTREYVTNLHGKNLILEQYQTIKNTIHEERQSSYIVEDWDMNNLKIGEAIISLPFSKPFKFHFELFDNRRVNHG